MSKIQVNEIVNHFDNGAPDCPKGLTVTGFTTFSGSVSIGGTLTYEDVTNVESIGVATFRDDVNIGVGGTTAFFDVSTGRIGIGTDNPGEPLSVQGATDQGLLLQSYNTTSGAVDTGPYIYGNFNDGATNRSAGSIAFLKENGTSGNHASYMAFRTRANGGSPTERFRIDSAGRLLIGTSTVSSAGDAALARLRVSNNSANSFGAGVLSIERGEAASAMSDADLIGRIVFSGTTGGDFAYIEGRVDGTPSGSVYPGALRFSTTEAGDSTPTERMRITNEGRFHFSNNTGDSSRYGNTINNSISSSTADQWALVVENNSDTSPFGLLIDFDDAAPDNTTNDFIRCTDSGATRMEVRSDGDVWTSDSGVLTSDATLKRDITDATPKLDDLMRLRVRNFYWTPEYHPNKQDKKLIGFIAQEVEEVFPGLVTHDNCISGGDPICDEEGNYTGEKTPEVLKKGLKEAKLVPILVKALQEAVERIETLEAKVTALEGA